MEYKEIAVSFLFGLCIGSFLNVLIDRLPAGKNPWKGILKASFLASKV